MEVKEFDVEEVCVAIEQNGLPLLRREWVTLDENKRVIAGCVLMQGAKNLGVVPVETVITDEFEFPKFFLDEDELTAPEVYNNSLKEQLDQFRVSDEQIDEQIRAFEEHDSSGEYDYGLGGMIIAWNDAYVDPYDRDSGYLLPTQSEVFAKVRELMTPFFGKKINLLTMNYDELITLPTPSATI